MPNWFLKVSINGEDLESEFYSSLASLEVEDNGYKPDIFIMRLFTSKTKEGEWQFFDDERINLLNNIVIKAGFRDGIEDYLIDGYITMVKPHLDREELKSYIEITGMDATYLMNLEEKVRSWSDVKDSDIASIIFKEYEFSPQVQETEIEHREDEHTMIQRGTDIQFLKTLASGNGFECYVEKDFLTDEITGIFGPPRLDLTPQKDLAIHFGDNTNIINFDAQIDSSYPIKVEASQIDALKKTTRMTSLTDTSIAKLGDKNLKDLIQSKASSLNAIPTIISSTHVASSQTELESYASGIIDRGAWFIIAEGEVESFQYGSILKSNRLVLVKGAGSMLSGKYYVSRVIHSFTFGPHPEYRQHFEARKNALGLDGTERFGSSK